jgi:hypothetical protein
VLPPHIELMNFSFPFFERIALSGFARARMLPSAGNERRQEVKERM